MTLLFLFFAWLSLSLLMVFAIDLMSAKLGRKGWERFVLSFVGFYAQILLTEFLLGLTTHLNAITLAILNIAISGAILYYIGKRFGFQSYKEHSSRSLMSFKENLISLKQDPFSAILITLGTGLLLWVTFLGILFPVVDWDGNAYHLTFVGNVIQNQHIFDTPTNIAWITGYPKGGEMVELWYVIFTRNDFIADLVQLPFVVLGVYALYTIVRQLGAPKKIALFTSLLYIFMPILINELKTTYVDVMLCSLFFAALAISIKQKLRSLDFVLLGTIYSFILSLKASGALMVAATLMFVVWNIYQQRSKKRFQISIFIKPLLLMSAPLVFGLYWYIKNWILFGSPLYPFGVKVLGTQIFPGTTFQDLSAASANGQALLPKGCLERIWFVWTEQAYYSGCLYSYDSNYAGFGPIWFIVLLPAILIGTYLAIRYKKHRIFLPITGALLIILALYPSNYYSRYTFFLSAVGIMAFALVLMYVKPLTRRFAQVLTVILAAFVLATTFTLCTFTMSAIGSQIRSMKSNETRGHMYEDVVGKAYVVLQDNMKQGEIVSHDSFSAFVYPLWKKDFSNKVVYIPLTTPEQWYTELRRQRVSYVFGSPNSPETNAAESLGMKQIHKDKRYEVYKVN